MTTRQIQTRLSELGFDPGPIDGIPGRQTTRAVIAFQRARRLEADGIVGPKTLSTLFPQPAAETDAHLPWLELARRKKGLTEGRDQAELSKFLKSDGKTLGDPTDVSNAHQICARRSRSASSGGRTATRPAQPAAAPTA